MYNANKTGPRSLPCGTPLAMADHGNILPMMAIKLLTVKKSLIQDSTGAAEP